MLSPGDDCIGEAFVFLETALLILILLLLDVGVVGDFCSGFLFSLASLVVVVVVVGLVY